MRFITLITSCSCNFFLAQGRTGSRLYSKANFSREVLQTHGFDVHLTTLVLKYSLDKPYSCVIVCKSEKSHNRDKLHYKNHALAYAMESIEKCWQEFNYE